MHSTINEFQVACVYFLCSVKQLLELSVWKYECNSRKYRSMPGPSSIHMEKLYGYGKPMVKAPVGNTIQLLFVPFSHQNVWSEFQNSWNSKNDSAIMDSIWDNYAKPCDFTGENVIRHMSVWSSSNVNHLFHAPMDPHFSHACSSITFLSPSPDPSS